jgi:putative nucleotidyltransferase-like protein
MDRHDLLPTTHRGERQFLLDVLADRIGDVTSDRIGDFTFDPAAFREITPSKLWPLVFVRLQPHAPRIPKELLATFGTAYRQNLMKELRRRAELRRLDEALTGANVRYLVLKGPVLAENVYPDRASRTMTDLDLLLSEDDYSRAKSALEQCGYSIPARFHGAPMAAGDTPPMIHNDPGGPSIELHTMIDSLPEERRALEVMWPLARRVPIGPNMEAMTLERGEFFTHVVAHVSKHHRFEGELRSLLDVALLLREPLPFAELWPVWESRGLSAWISLTVTLAHHLLYAPLPEVIANHPPSDEALALAAEQLWIVEKTPVAPRITHALSRTKYTDVHTTIPTTAAPTPIGLRGLRANLARETHQLRRAMTALREAALRPRRVATEIELHRKRERLFAIVESSD